MLPVLHNAVSPISNRSFDGGDARMNASGLTCCFSLEARKLDPAGAQPSTAYKVSFHSSGKSCHLVPDSHFRGRFRDWGSGDDVWICLKRARLRSFDGFEVYLRASFEALAEASSLSNNINCLVNPGCRTTCLVGPLSSMSRNASSQVNLWGLGCRIYG